jgi:hypothetical protein
MSIEKRKPELEPIAAYLSTLTEDSAVLPLLACSLGRVFANMSARGEEWRASLPMEEENHVVDWLAAAVASGEAWLGNKDEFGRPRKLLKFSTPRQVVAEADKAMLKFSQRMGGLRLSEGDEAVAATLAEGHVMVRLLTPAALDRESGEMQHCIGQGAYDAMLVDGSNEFYSLRDRFGKAHATLHVSLKEGRVREFRGKQNEEPLLEYVDLVLPFLVGKGMCLDQSPGRPEWVYSTDGRRHHVKDLPADGILHGDIRIEDVEGLAFPKSVSVLGSLHVRNCEVVEMPQAIRVKGEARFVGGRLPETPASVFSAEGQVEFVGVSLENLAERSR